MYQQFTPVIVTPMWANIFSKPRSIAKFCLTLFSLFWLMGLHASPAVFDGHVLNIGEKILGDTTLIEASICSGNTYLFDGQSLSIPGEYSATYIAADGSDSTVTLLLSVLPISLTNLDATICAGELYAFNGQNLDQTGTYTETLPAENGCDSIVTLHLNVLEPVQKHLDAAICTGTTYLFQGDSLTDSGDYSLVLTSSVGCDSIVSLHLVVAPFFETPIKASICPGGTYSFAGVELTNAGIYTDTLEAIGGCDSIILLNLSIRPTATTQVSASMCNGSQYDFYGDLLSDSGTYEAHFTGSNGCDSTVVLKLDVVDFYDIQLEATICTGEFFYFDGDNLDAEGVYTYHYTAQGGCDSTVTITLHLLPVSTGAGSATICAGGQYAYNGTILTAEGIYTFVLESANGCDSTVTFTLNVLPEISTSLSATICQGESYPFSGENFSDAGTYTAIYEAENGCDSTVTLILSVLPVQQTELSATICNGDSYNYNGELLTDAGTYKYLYSGENGCDSTVTLVLTVNPIESTQLSVHICAGDAYEFDGALITDAGTYTAVYSSVYGCDSTVTLDLSLLPLQNTSIEATICANGTYGFNGEILTAAGTYTSVLKGSNGCDSTVILTLYVLPTQSTSILATICEGRSYDYNGFPLSTEGDFDFVYQGENGCDSTVTVSLTVLPVAKTSLEATICAGNSYAYNGETFTDGGSYEFVFDGYNGCDSVVTLHLTVLPLLESTIEVTHCIGNVYVFNGDTLTESGVYTHVSTGSNGCDSTTTLVLEFVSSFLTDLQVNICTGESYIFGTDTLNQSGEYTHLLTAEGGCDSTVNLSLTILPLSASSSDVSICEGESFDFNGVSLNANGTYSAVLTGVNGCDSTAVLNLTVLPLLSSTLEATICANEAYAFNGETLRDAGTYTAILTGSNGCDSTVVLTLNVLPLQGSSLSATICANEPYDFYGQTPAQTGVYTAALGGSNGCDSIITLYLEVLPLAHQTFAALECAGNSFEFNGEVFTQGGEYDFIYPGAGANGCDSVETLILAFTPVIPPTNTSASICDNGGYDFYGMILTVPGTYTQILTASAGCDSLIVLTLTVNPTPFTDISASICAGDSYTFNGQTLTGAGTYFEHLQSAAGCDSTVVLTLTVNTVNTNVTLQGGTITSQATNATFQWINCATNQLIAGATEGSYTPAATGNYAVVVTQLGCTATSTCVFVLVTATSEPLTEQTWALQPNPATSQTQLVFAEATKQDLRLEIHDLAGRLMYTQTVTSGTSHLNIDLSGMPNGILVVRLATEHTISTKRLMKGDQ